MRRPILTTILVTALIAGTGVMSVARADDQDPGKALFTMQDDNGHSCATCHPKGGTNGKKLDGHRIPSLIAEVGKLSESKIREKIKKHLDQDVDLELTDAQFEQLVQFVSDLPKKGY